MKYLKRLLIILLCYLGIFGVVCLVGFYITGNEPTTLITAIFGSAGVELIISGAIKIFEKKSMKNESENENES